VWVEVDEVAGHKFESLWAEGKTPGISWIRANHLPVRPVLAAHIRDTS
jgi:hypothetical protein